MEADEFIKEVEDFDDFGTKTVFEDFEWEVNGRTGVTRKAINEFWTSAQRQGHSLHEISYRACFKPQLPAFFISRLTKEGDGVYDPFMGRGTTLLEAFLQGRKPLGNDINPLSAALLEARINPPTYEEVEARLNRINLSKSKEKYPELEVFFHPDTLRQIIALKEYFLQREKTGKIDNVDKWIRMVAINRLTGHSPGFFSVYSLPPNQAVSIKSQRKINEKREQAPESKEIKPLILKRTKSLLKDWNGAPLNHTGLDLLPTLTVQDAAGAMSIPHSSAGLVVTSPPFLDVVDYQGDNWMRCWFLGIDASKVEITELKKPEDWKAKMTEVMRDLRRILKPNGYLAFEVGEVTYKKEKLLLEELVLEAGVEAGLEPLIIMINDQEFTKTSNAWGVDNQSKGTNTNRIVIFQKVANTNQKELDDLLLAIKGALEELIERWNRKKIYELETLYEGPWKEVVLHLDTQEITKIISPLFTRLLGIGVEKKLPAFSMDEGKGRDFKYDIDEGELLVEGKITLSEANSWTGNYADKVPMHLLIRLKLNSDGKITGVFCCLVDLSKCKGKWLDTESNFSGLKLAIEDKKHMQLIKGKVKPKLKWLGYELESVNSEEE